jgi:hypothetical protein
MSSAFNSVPKSAKQVPLFENRNGKLSSDIVADKSSATATAGAATCHANQGIITSESLTTAAGAVYTLTLTNRLINSGSSIFCIADAGSSTGSPCVINATAGSGTATIKVQNVHSATAFNAAIKIHFRVL